MVFFSTIFVEVGVVIVVILAISAIGIISTVLAEDDIKSSELVNISIDERLEGIDYNNEYDVTQTNPISGVAGSDQGDN